MNWRPKYHYERSHTQTTSTSVCSHYHTISLSFLIKINQTWKSGFTLPHCVIKLSVMLLSGVGGWREKDGNVRNSVCGRS
ncbi:unnamed protein product [Lactuca virosa]|uniref:Uncharacterized protein n=1 Tax=Lactuca virosa TaxID=75947 RepID=A0AAU9NHL2_9ASTR|nr:unnamed protein product [Lactuca virosa]